MIEDLDFRPGSAVQLSSDLRTSGYGPTELAKLTRVRRGAYASTPPSDAEEEHRRLIAATLPQLSPEACLSHHSAALLHGLPWWGDQVGRVHVTRSRNNGGRRGSVVHVHPAPLPPGDVVDLDGIPVTSLARTVADSSRALGLSRAVAVGDAGLRHGMVRSDLLEQLEAASGRVGINPARRAAQLVDGRAESVGESFSRVTLHQLGLAPTTLQLEVFDEVGRLVARTDFGWPEFGTVAEFDGQVKYGRLLKPGQTPGDVVSAEKQREDRLRDLGWQVVRWVWADLQHRAQIADRLHRAFARGRSGHSRTS